MRHITAFACIKGLPQGARELSDILAVWTGVAARDQAQANNEYAGIAREDGHNFYQDESMDQDGGKS